MESKIGETELATEELFIYSGKENKDDDSSGMGSIRADFIDFLCKWVDIGYRFFMQMWMTQEGGVTKP